MSPQKLNRQLSKIPWADEKTKGKVISAIKEKVKESAQFEERKIDKELSNAVRKGDVNEVLRLVAMGADVNAESDAFDGWTPLDYAAAGWIENSKKEIIDILCSHGADVNKPDRHGMTPILCAASTGRLTPEITRQLAGFGADLGVRTPSGATIFMVCQQLDVPLAECFLELGADIHALDGNGNNVLMLLAQETRLTPELLYFFIGHSVAHPSPQGGRRDGADIYKKDKNNNSLLASVIFSSPHSKLLYKNKIRSTLALLNLGLHPEDMYPDWTPENFVQRINTELDESIPGYQADIAILIAMYIFPEMCDSMNKLIRENLSAGAEKILEEAADLLPEKRFLQVILECGRGTIAIESAESRKNMAALILRVFEESPVFASDFFQKRIGKRIEVWIKKGIYRAEELLARTAPYIKNKKQEKNMGDNPFQNGDMISF